MEVEVENTVAEHGPTSITEDSTPNSVSPCVSFLISHVPMPCFSGGSSLMLGAVARLEGSPWRFGFNSHFEARSGILAKEHDLGAPF